MYRHDEDKQAFLPILPHGETRSVKQHLFFFFLEIVVGLHKVKYIFTVFVVVVIVSPSKKYQSCTMQ